MKVLLLNPYWPVSGPGRKRYRRAWPPLDLLTAAAVLRLRGHQPELIDARAVHWDERTVLARAKGADMVVLQSTPLDRWQCPDLDWPVLGRLARTLPTEKLVLAGAHGTLRTEFVLQETKAAAVVRGEPEWTLAALADAGLDPRGVPGAAYIEDGRVVIAPAAAPADLDALPAPAYDLASPRDYRYELMGPRLALVETSRGCPFSCNFCLKAMYGPGIRFKSIDRVLAEVEEVVGRWGAAGVYFFDLEFTLSRDRTVALCRGLKRSGLRFQWCCQTRVDSVDSDLLRLMKESGCRLIHFGIETGSPLLLERTGKNVTLEQAERAVDACRRLGIRTACFFLMGLPGETGADRRATRRAAAALDPTYASFHVAAPYPGTPMGETAAGRSPFPACLEDEHDPAELGREVRKAFLAFYLRPRYILGRFRDGSWKDHLKGLGLLWEFLR